MESRKKTLMFIVSMILFSSIIIFAVSTISLDVSDNNSGIFDDVGDGIFDDEKENITEKDIRFEGNVNVSGIQTEDGFISINYQELISAHSESIDKRSVKVTYSKDNKVSEIRKFNENIYVNKERNVRDTEKFYDGRFLYKLEKFEDQFSYTARMKSINDNKYKKDDFMLALMKDLKLQSFNKSDENEYVFSMKGNTNLTNIENIVNTKVSYSEARFIVTENNIIKQMTANITLNKEFGVSSTTSYKYSVDKYGGVIVDRPNWVVDAQSSVSVIDYELNTEKNWIQLEHMGLSSIPKGTEMQIIPTNGQPVTITLSSEFEIGDTLYLSPTDIDSWNTKIGTEPQKGRMNLNNETSILIVIRNNNSSNTDYYRDVISSDG